MNIEDLRIGQQVTASLEIRPKTNIQGTIQALRSKVVAGLDNIEIVDSNGVHWHAKPEEITPYRPTLAELTTAGEFIHNNHLWLVTEDPLGYTVERDNQVYQKYAFRAGVADDIHDDIYGT